jgi:hypothetical protein
MLNGVALVLFIVATALSLRAGQRATRQETAT